eukprot:TRINITY_DN4766_c0_g1_i2.p3 TRINITY_DN4766_c0_g1~~TRINITY_DN4766_c0_g1_i2.p3  ORF type:complete len:207 (+),score=37.82 TRINITY_DN4766_c0_g1_i2:1227-1847(+)
MSVIVLNSNEGQQLLKTANLKTHDLISKYFVKQKHPTLCGIVSTSIALNALKDKNEYDEDNIWSKPGGNALKEKLCKRIGVTLDDLSKLLKSLGDVEKINGNVKHASNSSKGEFVELATKALDDTGSSAVLINFDPSPLIGKPFSGHVSPLVAHTKNEQGKVMFLLMDVWPETDSMWVDEDKLWDSINTMDWDAKKTRGFVILSKQ